MVPTPPDGPSAEPPTPVLPSPVLPPPALPVQPAVPPRPPEVRISDAERERAVDLLKTATGEGRLTLDEFSERAGAIYAARTRVELDQVMADLPRPYRVPSALADRPGSRPEIAGHYDPAGPVEPAGRHEPTRWTVGIMGGGKRRGRYRLRRETNAVAFLGGCDLDLRHAEVEGTEIVINAVAVMGGVDIVVPEGIAVELSGIAIMGAKDLKGKEVPTIPGSPVVRVRAFAFMGAVAVKTKPVNPDNRFGRGRRRGQLPADAGIPPGLGSAPTFASNAGEGPAGALPGAPVDAPSAGPEDVDGIEGNLIDAAAHGRLPLQKLRALPEGTVTLAFVDLNGPSDAAERADVVGSEVSAAGGHLIATKDHQVIVAFTGAAPALRFAIGIQDAFSKRNTEQPNTPVQVRVGLHAGEMSRATEDFFAGTVIVAAGVTKEANDGQILASSVLRELCDLSGEFEFGPGEEMVLDGLSTPRRLYPVIWSGRP